MIVGLFSIAPPAIFTRIQNYTRNISFRVAAILSKASSCPGPKLIGLDTHKKSFVLFCFVLAFASFDSS